MIMFPPLSQWQIWNSKLVDQPANNDVTVVNDNDNESIFDNDNNITATTTNDAGNNIAMAANNTAFGAYDVPVTDGIATNDNDTY